MFISKRVKEAKAIGKAEQIVDKIVKLSGGSRDNYIAVMNMITAKFAELDEKGDLR